MSQTTVLTNDPLELVLSRVFDAPRALVFEAWAKPEHMNRWWGPKGFTMSACEMDFRTGGSFYLGMRGPDGTDYPFRGTYDEVVVPERIVFSGEIHDGNFVRTTVTFVETAGKTTVTVRQVYSTTSEATRGAPVGWSTSLDRLAEHLARGTRRR
jgi:uncharacterized protein YndB with AHSA1/START domain